MAQDWIKVDVNASIHASQLLSLTQVARQTYDQAVAIRDRMLQHNYVPGTPGDASGIEALYGLLPGNGQSVLDLLNGMVGVMEGTMENSDFKTFTEKVG